MRLASTSNHLVYTDGERWLKKPRNSGATAHAEIARDIVVNRALGRAVEALDDTMILEHLGEPVPADEFHISDAAKHLQSLHQTPINETDLLSVDEWRADVEEKVEERLADHPGTRAWAHKVFASVGPPPATTSGGLAISDPHSMNWVRHRSGTLHPLDFETTCWADQVMSLACLVHYAVVEEKPIPIEVHVEVRRTGRWFFTMKAVAAVAWLARNRNTPEDLPARIRRMEASPYWGA